MTLMQSARALSTGDPYRVLQLQPGAPRELIEEGYWLLIGLLRSRPYTREIRAQIVALNNAYSRLSDEEARKAQNRNGTPGSAVALPLWSSDGHSNGERGKSVDYHFLLRIAHGAEPEIVDLAYRIMASRLELNGSDDELVAEQLRIAWRILRDPDQRDAHEAGLRLDGTPPHANGHHTATNGVASVAEPFKRTPESDTVQLSLWPPGGDHGDAPEPQTRWTTPHPAPDLPANYVRLVEKYEATGGLPREVLAQRMILPLQQPNGTRIFAVSSPEDVDRTRRLLAREGIEAEVTFRDRAEVQRGLVDLLMQQDQYDIVFEHADRAPQLSARRLITRPQIAAGAALLVAIIASFLVAPVTAAIALIGIATLVHLVCAGFKCMLTFRALSEPCEIPIHSDDIARLDVTRLPVYSVLLPLYREPEVVLQLVDAIARLDYPADKLDVKLLLEADDVATQAVVAQLELPRYFQVLIVPPDGPRGKPKACNYGLAHARGDYVVLYDAEDRPEADQLKKAIVAFDSAGPLVSCLQAKLNYYNPDQNLLTKWFTIEYSTWFDLYLPALNRIRAPIALGGTSNHFRIDVLRRVGGWDPFNVTEDADLGIRLARYQFYTGVIDSVTYEEANSRLGNWIRQRSRWIKGYILTWLVHMRDPALLYRQLGAAGFLAFQAMVFGTFFSYFVNPIFWGLVVVWYATHSAGIETLFPTPLLYVSTAALFLGNFIFVFTGVAGCLRRDYFYGVKYALFSPIYWLLMSVAAWKALYQLFSNPYYWEKTQHGLAPASARGGSSGAH